MTQPSSAMILAAGFGTRMGALTATQPKPLLKVAGKPLIDHAVALANAAGVAMITANLHYRHEALARHLTPLGISQSLELPDILDTGGGLRQALPLLSEGPVFTLNSDAIWRGPNPLSLLAASWQPSRMDALLMLVPQEKALGHAGKGDFQIGNSGKLARGVGLVYSGVQIIKPDLLHTIKEKMFSLNKVWDIMLKSDRLFGIVYSGSWCDVGSPEGITLAERLLEKQDV